MPGTDRQDLIPINPPGPSPVRGWLYTEEQEVKWRVWSDWLHAQAYGFGHTRMAMPGSFLPEEQVLERQKQILHRMEAEHGRAAGSRVPEPDEIPWHLWEYICEAMIPYPSKEAPTAGLPRRSDLDATQ